jgi:TRAP-type uncharacterized transport system fused permease subunit
MQMKFEPQKENNFEKESNVEDILLGNAPEAHTQEILEKFDKESSTRTLSNVYFAKMFFWFCVAVSLYHFVTSFWGTPVVLKHRSLHVAVMLSLGFVMYPFGKRSSRKKVSWCDWILIIVSFFVPLYVWGNYLGIIERAGNPNIPDMVMATILVLLVLESTRRITGCALPILSLIFILYGLYGRNLPGMFAHLGYKWMQLSNHFFANT